MLKTSNISTESVKRADALGYDATAGRFDVLTEYFSTDIAARMIEIAGARVTDRVLDVGTGRRQVDLSHRAYVYAAVR